MTGEGLSAFLADYRERCEDRGESPIPEAKLRAVLEDFVLTELWQKDDPALLGVACTSLRRILAGDQAAMRILQVIESEVDALRRKLDRQRAANMILHEHAVMLSDRLARPSDEGQ